MFKISLLMLICRVYNLILMLCMILHKNLDLILKIFHSMLLSHSKTNVTEDNASILIKSKILTTYLGKTKRSQKESLRAAPKYIRKLCVVHISEIIFIQKWSFFGPCFLLTAALASPPGPSPPTSPSCQLPGAASSHATSGSSFLGTCSGP